MHGVVENEKQNNLKQCLLLLLALFAVRAFVFAREVLQVDSSTIAVEGMVGEGACRNIVIYVVLPRSGMS